MSIMSDAERTKARAKMAGRKKMLEGTLQTMIGGYTNAAFIWGPPGLGKSYIVRNYLDLTLASSWQHHTAYTTPKGLLLALAEQPNALHLFEDCERMLKHELSASILRAACGEGPIGQPRWITYETANEKLKVNFRGSIVIITNQNLAKGPGPIQGVASRFRPVQWNLAREEVIACILDISDQGFSRGKVTVLPKTCHLVAKELLTMVDELTVEIPLDIRLFTEHALPTYASCASDESGERWKDILVTKLSGLAGTASEHREDRSARLQQLAASIAADSTLSSKDKVEKWKKLTTLGQAIYYRHLKKAKGR